MSDRVNRRWRLETGPVGRVKESDFDYVEEPAASPAAGQALVRNDMDRIGEATVDLGTCGAEGRLVAETDVEQGMENVPKTFLRWFEGKDRGKQLCQIGEPA